MKKFLNLFVLALFAVFALSACAPTIAGFVQLPEDVRAGIGAVVLVAVSWALAKLISLWKPLAFLEEFRVPLASAIAFALVDAIQNAVPDAYGSVAILALQLVLAVLALFLTFERFRQKGYRLF